MATRQTRNEQSSSSQMSRRRFAPPWSVDETDPELDRRCFIVRDANGQGLAYVYCEEEPGRRAAAHLLTRDGGAPDRGQHREASAPARAGSDGAGNDDRRRGFEGEPLLGAIFSG